jgi:hypothetical protein
MEGAVKQAHFQAEHRVSTRTSVKKTLAQSLLDRRNELPRNRAAGDLVDEDQSLFAVLQWLEGETNARHLPGAATLLAQGVVDLARPGRGRTIGDLRRSHNGINIEVLLQFFNGDLQVQFAHASQERLSSFPIDDDAQRRIAARHQRQGLPQSFLVAAGPRLDHRFDDPG